MIPSWHPIRETALGVDIVKERILMLGTDMSTRGGIGSVVRNYAERGLFDRLSIRYLPTHRDGSKAGKALFYVLQFPRIILGILAAELVHFQTSQGWSYRRLFVFFVIAKVLRKRTIWHVHGSSFDTYYRTSSRLERAAIGFGLRQADAVIALSELWRQHLLEIAPESQVRVIHNGVNVERYHVQRTGMHTPRIVLFLGRLGERKGVFDLLRAAGLLRGIDVKFRIAGDGDVKGTAAATLAAGLDKNVEVLGWVDDAVVVELLGSCDLYVLPSYDEGLPMGILEAMAAGIPVIATAVGGIPEAVIDGENGYLIQPGDYGALADRITRLLSDEVAWLRASELSRKRADEFFSMDRVERSLTALYTELL
jgi:glycosyltransferase involved in cell wall biosynthesis